MAAQSYARNSYAFHMQNCILLSLSLSGILMFLARINDLMPNNVIPIFVFCMLRNEPLLIFGDGEQTRDFVHVNDVVQANINAADAIGVNSAFNIASGKSVSINRLVEMIIKKEDLPPKVEYGTERPGDVLHSLADISLAHKKIDYTLTVDLERGLEVYVEWARNIFQNQ
jgi:nucleoside-diphosphate-sugar epimerase